LNLVAWRKKIPGFASQAACQAKLCRSIYSDHLTLERLNGFEQILAHRIDCQRAILPVMQKGYLQPEEYLRASGYCQQRINVFHSSPYART